MRVLVARPKGEFHMLEHTPQKRELPTEVMNCVNIARCGAARRHLVSVLLISSVSKVKTFSLKIE
jgi:hypothetical protein